MVKKFSPNFKRIYTYLLKDWSRCNAVVGRYWVRIAAITSVILTEIFGSFRQSLQENAGIVP
jgi:hypothetical protein